jgi:hypothetical protein
MRCWKSSRSIISALFVLILALAVPASAGAGALAKTQPLAAASGGTAAGAQRAVVHALREEQGAHYSYWRDEVHCRRTTPSHFGCSFRTEVEEGPYVGYAGPSGRVSVAYRHGHYYVGEPRFKPGETGFS